MALGLFFLVALGLFFLEVTSNSDDELLVAGAAQTGWLRRCDGLLRCGGRRRSLRVYHYHTARSRINNCLASLKTLKTCRPGSKSAIHSGNVLLTGQGRFPRDQRA